VGGGIDPIFPNGRTRRARKNKRQQSRSTGAASKSGSEFANGWKDTRNVICNANRNCPTPRRTRRGSMRYHGSPWGERRALPQIQGGLPRLGRLPGDGGGSGRAARGGFPAKRNWPLHQRGSPTPSEYQLVFRGR